MKTFEDYVREGAILPVLHPNTTMSEEERRIKVKSTLEEIRIKQLNGVQCEICSGNVNLQCFPHNVWYCHDCLDMLSDWFYYNHGFTKHVELIPNANCDWDEEEIIEHEKERIKKKEKELIELRKKYIDFKK